MSLADLSIKRPIFITCVMIVLMVVGAASFKSLSVDFFPEFEVPVVAVVTAYPGAGPAEIETLISKPSEDKISTISGIKRLTSKSLEGVSTVIVEFNSGVNTQYAEQQVRDKINLAKVTFPDDATEPLIRKFDPSDQPIMVLGVAADLPPAEMYDLAELSIKPRLEQVNNVGAIDILGGRKREIHVELDRKKLKQREISATQVVGQLSASGLNIPSGKISQGEQETVFRALGEFESAPEINNTIVSLFGNEVPTRISDIATVKDTLEDEKSRAFVNKEKSLFLTVYRQSGSNTIAVVKDIKKQLAAIETEFKDTPGSPKITILQDSSINISNNVFDVYETIIIGIVLTVITVLFFLGNGRATLITGVALPISLIGAFILMYAANFSINIVSLLALSLAVGLLIDDAIVVVENIYRHIETGMDPKEAASIGTREIQLSVFAITLVIICVFAPVAFTSGIIGSILKQFGLTIAFSMMISLFVALTIIPMLTAYFANDAAHGQHHKKKKSSIWDNTIGVPLRAFDRFQTWLENVYEKSLRFTMKYPLATLLVAIAVFVGSLGIASKIPGTFIPEQDNGEMTITLDLPPGTNLDAMNKVAQEAEDVIRANKEVALTTLTVGNQNNESNKASMYVRLKPSKERGGTTEQFKTKLRGQLEPFAHANPLVKDFDPMGGGQNAPFMLNIISNDQQQLMGYAEKLIAALKKDNRLVGIDSTYRPGKPESQIILKKDAARTYGISTSTLGQELRANVEGFTPAKLRTNGEEYEIRVRMQEDQRDLNEQFSNIWVPNVNHRLIRLSDIAELKKTTGPASIDRQNRGRYVQITASLASGAGLSAVLADSTKLLNEGDLKMPEGMRYSFGGSAENFQDMASSMGIALAFAILFIYLILASLYESFVTPFTVLLALPLALMGAFFALYIMGQTINLFAILGTFMLLGVACKNSILLVDFAKQKVDEGYPRKEAIIMAGKTRLRPILMTSFALIAGTLPIAYGLNEASKQRVSMGMAIIGGMITSTILTLYVVPAAFDYMERFRLWSQRVLARLAGVRIEQIKEKSAAPAKTAESNGANKAPSQKIDASVVEELTH